MGKPKTHIEQLKFDGLTKIVNTSGYPAERILKGVFEDKGYDLQAVRRLAQSGKFAHLFAQPVLRMYPEPALANLINGFAFNASNGTTSSLETKSYVGTVSDNVALLEAIAKSPHDKTSSIDLHKNFRGRAGKGASSYFKFISPDIHFLKSISPSIENTPVVLLGGGMGSAMVARGLVEMGWNPEAITVIDKYGKFGGIWTYDNVTKLSRNNPFDLTYFSSILPKAPGPGQEVFDFIARQTQIAGIKLPIKGTVTRVEPGDLGTKVHYDFFGEEQVLKAPIVINCLGLGKPLPISRPGWMTTSATDGGTRWQQIITPELETRYNGKDLVFIGLGNSTAEMINQLEKINKSGRSSINYTVLTHYPEDSVLRPEDTVNIDGRKFRVFRDLTQPNLVDFEGDLPEIREAYFNALYAGRIISEVDHWDMDKKNKKMFLRKKDGSTQEIKCDHLFTLIGYKNDSEELKKQGFILDTAGEPFYDYDGEVNTRFVAKGRKRVNAGYFGFGAVLNTGYNPNAIVLPGMIHSIGDLLFGAAMRAYEYQVKKHPREEIEVKPSSQNSKELNVIDKTRELDKILKALEKQPKENSLNDKLDLTTDSYKKITFEKKASRGVSVKQKENKEDKEDDKELIKNFLQEYAKTTEKIELKESPKVEVLTPDKTIITATIDDLIKKGVQIYGDKLSTGLKKVQEFIRGKKGIIATTPLIVAGKAKANEENYLNRNTGEYFTGFTEEDVGIDKKGIFVKKGEPVLAVVHGGGLLNTPERLGGSRALTNGALALDIKEFDKLLEGQLPSGETIELYTIEDVKKGNIKNPFGRYGIVLDLETAQNTKSGNHAKDEYLKNPLVIARAGSLEFLEQFFEKQKSLTDNTMINDHSLNSDYRKLNPNIPQGRPLYIFNSYSGIQNYHEASAGSARFIGIIQEDKPEEKKVKEKIELKNEPDVIDTKELEEKVKQIVKEIGEEATRLNPRIEIVSEVPKFSIEELPERYRLKNVMHYGKPHIIEWGKKPLRPDNYTQKRWAELTKTEELRLASLPVINSTFTALVENEDHPDPNQMKLIETVKEMFRNDYRSHLGQYPATSTAIDGEHGLIIHNFGYSDEKRYNIQIPKFDSSSLLIRLAEDPKTREMLEILFGVKLGDLKDHKKIDGVYADLIDGEQPEIYYFQYPSKQTIAVWGFGGFKDKLHLLLNAESGVERFARGVYVRPQEQEKIEIKTSETKETSKTETPKVETPRIEIVSEIPKFSIGDAGEFYRLNNVPLEGRIHTIDWRKTFLEGGEKPYKDWLKLTKERDSKVPSMLEVHAVEKVLYENRDSTNNQQRELLDAMKKVLIKYMEINNGNRNYSATSTTTKDGVIVHNSGHPDEKTIKLTKDGEKILTAITGDKDINKIKKIDQWLYGVVTREFPTSSYQDQIVVKGVHRDGSHVILSPIGYSRSATAIRITPK